MRESHGLNEFSDGAGPSGQKASGAEASDDTNKSRNTILSSSLSSSNSSSTSSSSEETTIEENRPRPPQAPIGGKSICPVKQCGKEYSHSNSVQRHMRKFHGLASDVVAEYKIATVLHRCPYCGIQFSNLYAHQRHCKKKKTSEPVTPPQNPPPVLPAHNAEGLAIVPAISEWLDGQELSAGYKVKVVAKINRLITFWEETVADFKGETLLDPFEKGIMLPSLAQYHMVATTVGDKVLAVKAYLLLCDFILCQFNTRHAANTKFSLLDRTSYRASIEASRASESRKLKKLNIKQRRETKMAAERKALDPEQLSYNPERLKEVTTAILLDEHFNSLRETLAGMPPNVMKKRYSETYVRHFLMSQLWATGAGLRPSVFTNMTVGELQRPISTSDADVILVNVHNHKTAYIHGPAKVPFVLPNLYEAALAYMRTWRDLNNNDDDLLLATRFGNPASYDTCLKWLTKTLKALGNSFSENELKSLSGGTMRKGWSNWAQNSPDELVKLVATRVMCHSQSIANTNYLAPVRDEAGLFASSIVHSMGSVGNIDNNASNASDRDQEGPAEEVNVVPPPPPPPPSPPHPEEIAVENPLSARVPRFFLTRDERELICSALEKDGQLPTSVTSESVAIAAENSPAFGQLYNNLVERKGGKGAANTLIRNILTRRRK